MRRTLPLLLIASVVVLSGCADAAPEALRHHGIAERPPRFATDEEALALAKEVYREYLDIQQTALATGEDPVGLEEVATGEALRGAIESLDLARERGVRTVGQPEIVSFEAQDLSLNSSTATVVVYVCEDVSGVDVLDSTGRSIVYPDRPPRTLLVVGFDAAGDHLVVATHEVWSPEC